VIGIAYGPSVSFDEALRGVQASMEGLPEAIAEQGTTLGSLAPRVDDVGTESALLATEIQAADPQLEDARLLLDDYRAVLDEARVTLARAPSPSPPPLSES
jgi:hypothetical protein